MLARERDGEIFLHTLKTGGQVLLPVPAELEAALDCVYFFWNGVMSEQAMVRNVRRTLSAAFRHGKVLRARTGFATRWRPRFL